jgi:hypothetical protein
MTLQQRANAWSVTILLGSGVLYSFPPQQYHFYPLCPIYATTHFLCPGCGGTRALYQMLHLNFAAAWHFNALVTLAAPVFLVWFAYRYYFIIRHGRAPEFRIPVPATICLFALVLFFGVARNIGLAFVI